MTSFRYYIADKLKRSFYLGIFLLLIGFVNYGVWLAKELFVLVFIVALVLIKFVALSIRGFQARNEFSKPLVAVITITFFFLAASLFDFIVIPNLWVEKFGLSAEGIVTDLRTTTSHRKWWHIASYEFHVNGLSITKSQNVSFSMYEQLESSPAVEIKYLSENPERAYLRDPEHLKTNTFITLVLSFGLLLILYSYKSKNSFSNTDNVT